MQEIGGSVVELEHDGSRVVLDIGKPLGADLQGATLPAIPGLGGGDDASLLGVIVTHAHPDHVGLASLVHPRVPFYAGAATARVLVEASFFTPTEVRLQLAGELVDRRPFQLGPFRITPYLVDHSAFDAYALLVEAGGRRLVYSGDLRGHGRKAILFERLLAKPPEADVLLLEGTRIAECRDFPRGEATEAEVEERAFELCRITHGMVLALYSPQNVDRLVSLYRAARRMQRILVFDLYASAVAAATGRPETIPQAHWEGVRVFAPRSQKARVRREGAFERINAIRSARIFPEELASRAGELVLTFRLSMAPELVDARCLEGATSMWSLWPGYLERPRGVELREWLEKRGIPLAVAHTSGHATPVDLRRLVTAIAPGRVVPIHTDTPERFVELFTCAELHKNGERWDV